MLVASALCLLIIINNQTFCRWLCLSGCLCAFCALLFSIQSSTLDFRLSETLVHKHKDNDRRDETRHDSSKSINGQPEGRVRTRGYISVAPIRRQRSIQQDTVSVCVRRLIVRVRTTHDAPWTDARRWPVNISPVIMSRRICSAQIFICQRKKQRDFLNYDNTLVYVNWK